MILLFSQHPVWIFWYAIGAGFTMGHLGREPGMTWKRGAVLLVFLLCLFLWWAWWLIQAFMWLDKDVGSE